VLIFADRFSAWNNFAATKFALFCYCWSVKKSSSQVQCVDFLLWQCCSLADYRTAHRVLWEDHRYVDLFFRAFRSELTSADSCC
jgi:hypothetical protein